ncbi:unnamed protein product [Caenorhabditis auriculariae]|uniref:Phosphorylated adapter RNA export protein n=1 Tax=Caenorhabditis auriculariae TaxID=2777116 RepID=A0A8S1GYJ8_9PELO|nr:unnamed protein product [Caenorhabditis auriculariae]
MSYRRAAPENDSDEERPEQAQDDEDCGPSQPKKNRNLWSDMLLDEKLQDASARVQIAQKNNSTKVRRGPETYEMPPEVAAKFNKNNQGEAKKEETSDSEKPLVMITPACDNPFGDVTDAAPQENFGVKSSSKKEVKAADGWWCKRGHARKYGAKHESANNQRFGGKRDWQGKTNNPKSLLTNSYSLEALLAVDFLEGTPLEELGQEMARAFGERDPETVTKIVKIIGEEKAIALFNMTRDCEKAGGMMTADKSRRRTPGGVFITLFKTDSDVSPQTKDSIFGEFKSNEKCKKSNKQKSDFDKRLSDMKKTLDKAKDAEKEEPTVANVLLGDLAEDSSKEEMNSQDVPMEN